MRKLSIALLSAVALMATSTASFAACVPLPDKITPNVGDNFQIIGAKAGSYSFGQNSGTAYTKVAFCPAKAAPGTCTGESLSELERGGSPGVLTNLKNGNVPDIAMRQDGILIPLPGPDLFIPIGAPKEGACV